MLKKHGFGPVPGNERWRFQKILHGDRGVTIDWHVPSPTDPRNDIRIKAHRVKPGHSLNGIGIHGHENPEAVGSELHPFSFTHKHVQIRIPNSVTFVIMKLAAMRDYRERALTEQRADKDASLSDSQARKHGDDVYRAVAMMTRPESEIVPDVVSALRTTAAFEDVRGVFAEYFGSESGWGSQNVGRSWQPEDRVTMHSTLADWFR